MDLAFLEETKFCLPARRSCRNPSPAFPSPCPTLPALCRISAVNRRTPHQSQRGPLTGTGPAGGEDFVRKSSPQFLPSHPNVIELQENSTYWRTIL